MTDTRTEHTPARYKIGTLDQMAAIPAEALPRFLAELPAILRNVRDIADAAPVLAEQARSKAPWWLKFIPVSAYQRSFERSISSASEWVDDDKGTATITMRTAPGADPFFKAQAPLGDPA